MDGQEVIAEHAAKMAAPAQDMQGQAFPVEEEAEEKRPRRSRPRTRTVRLVRVVGESALVEFEQEGSLRRVTVPVPSDMPPGWRRSQWVEVEDDELLAGVPYGVPWEEAPVGEVSAADIAEGLRRAGIWTGEDLRTNQQRAVGVLQHVYRVDLAALNRLATESLGGEK